MIQHVVLVDFRRGVPHEARLECVRRLQGLAVLIPGMRHWRAGLNVTTMDRAWDLGVTGEFDSIEDMFAYRAHPAHLEAQKFVDAHAAETVGADFEAAA